MRWDPAIVGPMVAVGTLLLGYLGYRRSVKVDKAAANVAVIAAQTGSAGQVIAGLSILIENLQEDNTVWRQSVTDMSVRLAEVIKERDEIKKRYDALYKKYLAATRGR